MVMQLTQLYETNWQHQLAKGLSIIRTKQGDKLTKHGTNISKKHYCHIYNNFIPRNILNI